MEAPLQTHIDLCEQIYSCILEENQILKETNKPPEDGFLTKKRALLVQLDESVNNLRAINSTSPKPPQQRGLMEKAQQLILKTLLLDRENEQALLKCAFTAARPSVTQKPTVSHLQRIYGKHCT